MCAESNDTTKILMGLSGVIRSTRMTLVLGAPGSGKSTFLRVLAGKLDPSLKFEGKVTYKVEAKSSAPEHLSAYVSQHDLHHAEMTVRETINFSSNMLGTSNEFGMAVCFLCHLLTQNQNACFCKMHALDEVYLHDGLGFCNPGEMLVGRARCFFMDDVSTGLDSSTTYEIMTFLRQMAHIMGLTIVISLLQPSIETLALFDDIILLCEGQIIYHGPRRHAVGFFRTIGFTCPSRKNVADFLQEVTLKTEQKQYWTGDKSQYKYHSIEDFIKCFRAYSVPQIVEDNQCTENGSKQAVRAGDSFIISKWEIFKVCLSREVLLLKKNYPVHIFKVIQIMFLAFVVGTLFFRSGMNQDTVLDGVKYLGALFMGVAVINFNCTIELGMVTKRLPIFYKQRELLELPGWALVCSVFLTSLPVSLMESGLWTFSTYYAIGYAPSAIRLFQQLLALLATHQMSLGLYRLVATVGRTPIVSNSLGAQVLVFSFIFGGFIISKDNLQSWLSWGYWASPFTYALNAVTLNEFLDMRWAKVFYFKNSKTLGEAILMLRGLLNEWQWYWTCIGILFGFTLVFNILSVLALHFLKSPHKREVNIKSQDRQNKEYNDQAVVNVNASIGQSLPFQPLTLVFKNINYSVELPKGMRKHGVTESRLQLLRDVSGSFRPGVLTALMGITGAGKTTLLDVLAGRKTGGYIEGVISICGYPNKYETVSRITGYCEQTDIHSPYLTVYESLKFSASLRLPSVVKSHQRDMYVEEVMDLVELTGLRNAIVGIPGATGLSAEQRKRLTIAVELVASPSIMFLDEPTTGLDARAAAIVMRTVRKMVNTGHTVVCTIHQPSIQIFESFDELLLMKSGGQLIYSGSLGPLSRDLIKYFEAVPGVPKIKDGQNPAAWVLDISSHAMQYMINVDYAEIYYNSNLYKENMAMINELSKPKTNHEDLHLPSKYWPGFKEQCIACIWKQHLSYRKNSELNVFRFINTFATSIVFGIVFWQTGSTIKVEQDVFNILGIGYGSALFLGFVNCTSLLPVVAAERAVSYREMNSGMYSSMAFIIAQVAAEIPYMVIQPLIFSAIVYPMVGFQLAVKKFFLFVLYMILIFMDYTLYGMMAVALTPTAEIATGLSLTIFVVWNFFSGFIVTVKAMPVWWRWMYWACPTAWTLYGLVSSQLGDHKELIRVLGQPDQPVITFLQEYLGLENGYLPLVTALHFVLSALFCFVFCVGIKYLRFQKR
ncbi:ABC transporter G family member 34 [Zea mays]|uniref:ABC transporter G family member 34 n=1 Tax=Zea mays TaxID=4577 RepID=A0A1D6I198_MAIZE|nr:ABC transporter G family member 34 [Zea mays]